MAKKSIPDRLFVAFCTEAISGIHLIRTENERGVVHSEVRIDVYDIVRNRPGELKTLITGLSNILSSIACYLPKE
jgi:hypothetical protein